MIPMRLNKPCWWSCPVFLLALTTTAQAQAPAAKDKDDRVARLVVKLPDDAPDAQLKVDGLPTRARGPRRAFVSPRLEPGKTYSYTFTAVIVPNNYTTITRTRKVSFQAGKEVAVDMTSNDPREPDDIVVRWVPTPEPVVEAMLKLAGVGKDDVVYDLGCGDGRIVIAAVKDFGAKRGVGFDIDPERIAESRANAKAARVEGKVEFRQEDVLKIKDFSPASVVAMYMSDALGAAVGPDLKKTLKPGSRIVSHRFLLGDWKPDKTITVTHEGFGGLKEDFQLHLWTVPKAK
jgi:uncharacterized protein (TIGR03000 family)